MGDDIWLDDRNGLRTPMQWNGEVNAGFSEASPEALYAPVIANSPYGFETLNVAAQQSDQKSLLNSMRRLIAVRKEHPLFGLGKFYQLPVESKAVFAYLRSNAHDRVYVVNNLSDQAQKISLPEKDLRLVDLLTGKDYSAEEINLEPYEFLWFKIKIILFRLYKTIT
jgi:maltose alpha-D-glucosyltransferase/alpha-amylase